MLDIKTTYSAIIYRRIGTDKWKDDIYAQPINVSGLHLILNSDDVLVGVEYTADTLTFSSRWNNAKLVDWDGNIHIINQVIDTDSGVQLLWG